MRKTLIVGAQKLFLNLREAVDFAEQLVARIGDRSFPFDLAICPSLINLAYVASFVKGSRIAIGAQNVHQENGGAFTGQVAIDDLIGIEAFVGVPVKYVIVGHSELRNQQGETNEKVRQKVVRCLRNNLTPITCVGENRQQRESGKSEEVIVRDIREIFGNIPREDFEKADVVIAYEPVWAIKGSRDDKDTKAASSELANQMHVLIRRILSEIHGNNLAEKTRILYGGSVDSGNTKDYLRETSIDGLLVGNASIKLDVFVKILEVAESTISQRALRAEPRG